MADDWSWTPDETGLEDTGVPWLATDLMHEALRCDCDEGDGPLCVRCACLMRLVDAIEEWDDAHATRDDDAYPCLVLDADDPPCPYYGEAGCEDSCTGAILAREEETA